MKDILLAVGICAVLVSCNVKGVEAKGARSTQHKIVNGQEYKDKSGNTINAHGGGFIKVGNYYYWIGENRREGALISCYRSKDLVSWEYRGDLLTRSSNPELADANLERPKVIYNEKTKLFVMWMHYEKSKDYSYARAAVATSPDIEKPFTYIRSFRPLDNMSRDCNLFKDDDGTAYFVSSTRENLDMNIYELTDTYLDIKTKVHTLWPGSQREAPVIFKHGGYYFMLTSYCTGWEPNQGKYSFAKSIKGQWSALRNFGSSTTYDTQPTYVIPVQGKKKTGYIYVGDRWDPSRYFGSTYVFLPLTFSGDTTLKVDWVNTLVPDLRSGDLKTSATAPVQTRIKCIGTGGYMAAGRASAPDDAVVNAKLDYSADDMRWIIEKADGDRIRIRHISSGRYISADGDNDVRLSAKTSGDEQLWVAVHQYDSICKLLNVKSGRVLCIEKSGQERILFTAGYDKDSKEWLGNQLFLLAPVYE